MFIGVYKLNIKKIILVIVLIILFLIIIGVCKNISYFSNKEANIFNTYEKSINYNFKNIKTNEDRVSFLNQFGWEIEAKAIEIVEVQLPEKFNDVYLNYNNLQKEIGLDLEKYKGKRVKRYTYKVLNHPICNDKEVRANILVYNNRVVAGDIMTVEKDGFMHSLLFEQVGITSI